MKLKNIIFLLTISAGSIFTIESVAQNSEVSKVEQGRIDSLTMYKKEQIQTQKANDSDRMNTVRNDRRETKAKAKEAKRIEKEANAAARESKNAFKAERKAQNARRHADKQEQKAAKAEISLTRINMT